MAARRRGRTSRCARGRSVRDAGRLALRTAVVVVAAAAIATAAATSGALVLPSQAAAAGVHIEPPDTRHEYSKSQIGAGGNDDNQPPPTATPPSNDEFEKHIPSQARLPRFKILRLFSFVCFDGDNGPTGVPFVFHSGNESDSVGVYAWDRVINLESGESYVRQTCIMPGEAAPPPIPDPPTAEEVWKRVPLPKPAGGWSPAVPLTGMETYLWTDGVVGERSVSVTIRGWTATTTARPVEYAWSMGDGAVWRSAGPGSACYEAACRSQTGARHTYETKGDYTLRASVVWEGEFRLTGHGFDLGTVDLGRVTSYTSSPVHVREIRSVLTG